MKYVSLLILFYILCFSCQNNEKRIEFARSVELKGENLNIADSLGRSREIKIKDNWLIVSEVLGDKKLELFDLSSLTLRAKGGIAGKGPGEIMTAWNIMVDNDKDFFTIYDGQLSRILKYNIESFLQNEEYRPTDCVQLKGEALSCFNLERLSDTSYVGIGAFPDSRLLLINREGNTMFKGGTYPPKESENFSDGLHAVACQGTIIKHPDKNLLAVSTRFGWCLDIFMIDEQKKEIVLVKRQLESTPKYTQNNSNLVFLPEAIKGYIAMACDSKYIYALYSGQKTDLDTSIYGKKIHVFDWDGNPVLEMLLDRYVSGIDVKNGYLYALENNENIDLVRYKITGII